MVRNRARSAHHAYSEVHRPSPVAREIASRFEKLVGAMNYQAVSQPNSCMLGGSLDSIVAPARWASTMQRHDAFYFEICRTYSPPPAADAKPRGEKRAYTKWSAL